MRTPLLLFGLPRSGTTWLGKIFDSHPDTLYWHEPDSVWRLPGSLLPDVDGGEPDELALRAWLQRLQSSAPLKTQARPSFAFSCTGCWSWRPVPGPVWPALHLFPS